MKESASKVGAEIGVREGGSVLRQGWERTVGQVYALAMGLEMVKATVTDGGGGC